jgi:hypothetical protein
MSPAFPTRAAAVIVWSMMMCGVPFAQTPAPSTAEKLARPGAPADLESRQSKSAAELATELKARKEWELRRRQIVQAHALKRAECKQQASQQKLRLVKRWRFVKRCVGP